jgi:hypothetical protein
MRMLKFIRQRQLLRRREFYYIMIMIDKREQKTQTKRNKTI